jgi:hypothetical protein
MLANSDGKRVRIYRDQTASDQLPVFHFHLQLGAGWDCPQLRYEVRRRRGLGKQLIANQNGEQK